MKKTAAVLTPIGALIGGYWLALKADWILPPEYNLYLATAALAGVDSILGGIRAGLENQFQQDIFISGFIFNCLVAACFVWAGQQIGVDLFLAAGVLFGGRILLNVSIVRRLVLGRMHKQPQRER
jgi:small basic protein